MRRTSFKRRTTKQKKVRKVENAYKTPKWFNEIDLGSHGNTPAQRRYWKVISDLYREEDWIKYGGKCVSCPARLEHWKAGHLAHYKRWTVCNAWFKFSKLNLALSCPACNYLDDGPVGHAFGEELKRRYGPNHLRTIEEENLKQRGKKLETHLIVEEVARLRPDLVHD